MIELKFTQDELNALTALLDAGVKATGLQGVRAAAHLLGKLEDAAKAANDAKTED